MYGTYAYMYMYIYIHRYMWSYTRTHTHTPHIPRACVEDGDLQGLTVVNEPNVREGPKTKELPKDTTAMLEPSLGIDSHKSWIILMRSCEPPSTTWFG